MCGAAVGRSSAQRAAEECARPSAAVGEAAARASEESLALESEVVVDEGERQPVGGLVEHLDAQ